MQIRGSWAPWIVGAALVSAVTFGVARAGETRGAGARLKCRTFPTAIGAEIDTRDPGSELGTWVLALEDRGWEVASVDWDVGQKATGFPQGYTQVCLTPVSAP